MPTARNSPSSSNASCPVSAARSMAWIGAASCRSWRRRWHWPRCPAADPSPTRSQLVPYVEQPPDLVAVGAALLCNRVYQCRLCRGRAAAAFDGPAGQGRGQPAAPGQPRRGERADAGEPADPLRSAPRADDHRQRPDRRAGPALSPRFTPAGRLCWRPAARGCGCLPGPSPHRHSLRKSPICSASFRRCAGSHWEPLDHDDGTQRRHAGSSAAPSIACTTWRRRRSFSASKAI